MDICIAAKGDTLYSIAKRCGISPQRLAADNGISPQAPLITGQALLVRQVRVAHTVREGETLRGIATQYHLSVRALYRMNPHLHGLPRLCTGQTIAVKLSASPKRQLQVLGITSPCPNTLSLRAVLPFLTYVAPTPCRCALNGGLPISDTVFLFDTAMDYGVLPLLYLDGNESRRFVETAVYALAQSRAVGVVTTIENTALSARLLAEDRLCFSAFPTIVHPAIVTQKGRPDRYLSQTQALRLAIQHNATIRFDDTAKQPFFQFRDTTNAVCTVWLQDVRSWHTQLPLHTSGVSIPHPEYNLPLAVFLSTVCRIVE